MCFFSLLPLRSLGRYVLFTLNTFDKQKLNEMLAGNDPTATLDNNFQVPSMQVSAHDYSSTSSSQQQQQQEQQQHQQQETARYYLSVEGEGLYMEE